MKLDAALHEYELRQRRRRRGEDRQQASLALASLREYLLTHAAIEESTDLRSQDLRQFLLDYYPSQETPDAEVALTLLDAAEGLAFWLLERGERGAAAFAAEAERLRADLPRVIEAFVLLKEHAARDSLDTGRHAVAEEENEEEEVGVVSSGVDRVARLDQIDYAAAEEEYYTVRETAPGSLVLQSKEREALSEAPVRVQVPEEATGRLRPGDILHAEIAPGAGRSGDWELLEVFGIRPGGY